MNFKDKKERYLEGLEERKELRDVVIILQYHEFKK